MVLSRRSLFTRLGQATSPPATTAQAAPAQLSPAQSDSTESDPLIIRSMAPPPRSSVHHLLNRLTYGPSVEEVVRGEQRGYEATLEEQLNPVSIDDSACDAKLKTVSILSLTRRQVHKLQNKYYRSEQALRIGMILRAVYSRRQLLERMVEFWSDHFNIPSSDYSLDLVEFQRRVIRANALGNFQKMLIGVTKSPAMLYYLNNASSNAEAPNENYARELMELYTLGVDGGYTEQDVKEVARALTGWSVQDSTSTGFYFDAGMHDSKPKTILGHTFPADRGIEDGYHVLNLLARHPATARFVSRKLCVRFVSDNPPQSLVDSCAAVWQQSQGEIKSVLRHLFLSNEFKQATGQKFRRPLDFFIGALRATGTKIRERDTWLYEEILAPLGQLPFNWHPPNGYPDVAGAWISTGGLLSRWNTAMQLTHAAYSEPNDAGYGLIAELRERISTPTTGDPATVGELVDAVAGQVFGAALPEATRAHFIRYVTDGALTPDAPLNARTLGRKLGTLYGLMLASPEYQWR